MPDGLRVIIRTPHETVLDTVVRSIRVLTDTGHVGLRRGGEAVVLAVEAGLVLLSTGNAVRFVGSAGGLLSSDGVEVTLFTPLAVTGEDPAAVRAALDRALAEPGSEMALRTTLDRLEERIVSELRDQSRERMTGVGRRK
jgi:F0F1-type ATP synthase epsilon subunit